VSTGGIPPLPDRPVLEVKEVAPILGVNPKTLYAEIKAGRFPVIRLGRSIRISRSVVTSILEQGRVVLPASHAQFPARPSLRRGNR
jgi:excisionase family DNA binding protein